MNKNLGEIWQSISSKSRENKRPQNLNFKTLVVNHLGEKRSDVYTHSIHSYPGRIFPYIPIFLFSIPEICSPKEVILDTFAGSGTVMLESLVHPLYKRNVYGVEINPLGRLIAKVKTTPLNEEKLTNKLRYVLSIVSQSNGKEVPIPMFKNINFWFSKKAISKLSILKYSIDTLEDNDYKDFFLVCFSSIIRKVSKANPFIPPPVKLKVDKYEKNSRKYEFLVNFLKQAEDPDVFGLFEQIANDNINRIGSLNRVREIKEGKVNAKIISNDTRSLNTLRSGSIGLILTSPPYITAQKYIRTQKLELLWLGLLSENELKDIEKDSVGSERVSLKEVNLKENIGIKSIDSLISWASSISPQRAATLSKYFFDMKKSISEMYRVLKEGGYAILVVGNNQVLGKNVKTYSLLIDLAILSGFRLDMIFKDKIRRRGMITKRHNSGGLIKEEFIILLKKER